MGLFSHAVSLADKQAQVEREIVQRFCGPLPAGKTPTDIVKECLDELVQRGLVEYRMSASPDGVLNGLLVVPLVCMPWLAAYGDAVFYDAKNGGNILGWAVTVPCGMDPEQEMLPFGLLAGETENQAVAQWGMREVCVHVCVRVCSHI